MELDMARFFQQVSPIIGYTIIFFKTSMNFESIIVINLGTCLLTLLDFIELFRLSAATYLCANIHLKVIDCVQTYVGRKRRKNTKMQEREF